MIENSSQFLSNEAYLSFELYNSSFQFIIFLSILKIILIANRENIDMIDVFYEYSDIIQFLQLQLKNIYMFLKNQPQEQGLQLNEECCHTNIFIENLCILLCICIFQFLFEIIINSQDESKLNLLFMQLKENEIRFFLQIFLLFQKKSNSGNLKVKTLPYFVFTRVDYPLKISYYYPFLSNLSDSSLYYLLSILLNYDCLFDDINSYSTNNPSEVNFCEWACNYSCCFLYSLYKIYEKISSKSIYSYQEYSDIYTPSNFSDVLFYFSKMIAVDISLFNFSSGLLVKKVKFILLNNFMISIF
jgi:hypothetical protein